MVEIMIALSVGIVIGMVIGWLGNENKYYKENERRRNRIYEEKKLNPYSSSYRKVRKVR